MRENHNSSLVREPYSVRDMSEWNMAPLSPKQERTFLLWSSGKMAVFFQQNTQTGKRKIGEILKLSTAEKTGPPLGENKRPRRRPVGDVCGMSCRGGRVKIRIGVANLKF